MTAIVKHPTQIRLEVESAFDEGRLIDYASEEIERLERELAQAVSGLSESVTERDALKARLDYLLSTCSSDEEIRLRTYAEQLEGALRKVRGLIVQHWSGIEPGSNTYTGRAVLVIDAALAKSPTQKEPSCNSDSSSPSASPAISSSTSSASVGTSALAGRSSPSGAISSPSSISSDSGSWRCPNGHANYGQHECEVCGAGFVPEINRKAATWEPPSTARPFSLVVDDPHNCPTCGRLQFSALPKYDFDAPVAERLRIMADLYDPKHVEGGCNWCTDVGAARLMREAANWLDTRTQSGKKCETCGGKGTIGIMYADEPDYREPCPDCHQVVRNDDHDDHCCPHGAIHGVGCQECVPCGVCDGKGSFGIMYADEPDYRERCRGCAGTGFLTVACPVAAEVFRCPRESCKHVERGADCPRDGHYICEGRYQTGAAMTDHEHQLLLLVEASDAVRKAIEAQAVKLEGWAKDNAKRGDYQNAGLQQTAAVNIRGCTDAAVKAVADIIEREASRIAIGRKP